MKKIKSKDLISVAELIEEEIYRIFKLTKKLKKKKNHKKYLKGKILGLIFEKPSTRTRVSFEAGIYQLGGIGLYLNRNDLQLGRGETIKDTAIVLSRYLNGIIIRAFSHQMVLELAKYASIPVINALTDLLHPCQAISDFFTIYEYKKNFKNIKIAYIGDGNNVANSLTITTSKLGGKIFLASPKGYFINEEIYKLALEFSKKSNAEIILTDNPEEAAKDADVLYTDVWVSMGQENEKEVRYKIFKNYQINEKIIKMAKKDVIVMHCLPAHRGEEITDEVMDGPNSVVFDQAENRLHSQKAILTLLIP